MNPPLFEKNRMSTSLNPRRRISSDGIPERQPAFDLDQPPGYPQEISPKGVASWKMPFAGQKKGASQRTPTPTENHHEALTSFN
jgi:hypothetical protein